MQKSILVLGFAVSLVGCAHKGPPAGAAPAAAHEHPHHHPDGTMHEHPHGHDHEHAHEHGIVAGTEKVVHAHLAPKSGNTTLGGQATFAQTPAGVKLVLHVEGAPPGEHGAHIHEKGDCGDPEAKNAGGHWNPAGHKHGTPPPAASHLGDLGNLKVGEDGKGHLELTSEVWKIGDGSPEDLVGKAVVIHGGPDDLVTDPAGNSGPRIGCGVIHVAD
jgi:superoxide dismutase, Cu-Zn family